MHFSYKIKLSFSFVSVFYHFFLHLHHHRHQHHHHRHRPSLQHKAESVGQPARQAGNKSVRSCNGCDPSQPPGNMTHCSSYLLEYSGQLVLRVYTLLRMCFLLYFSLLFIRGDESRFILFFLIFCFHGCDFSILLLYILEFFFFFAFIKKKGKMSLL